MGRTIIYLGNIPSANISTIYSSVAEQMINDFRFQSCIDQVALYPDDPTSDFVNNIASVGSLNNVATLLDLQWEWLALPATDVVLTALFVGHVVRMSRDSDVKLWKNYTLPKMYYGLSPQVSGKIGGVSEGVEDVSDIQRKAADVKV